MGNSLNVDAAAMCKVGMMESAKGWTHR